MFVITGHAVIVTSC